MSSPQIPWDAVVKGLEVVAPLAVGALGDYLREQGYDLGPMTPDIRTDFASVDAEIDRMLDEKTED